MSYCVNCGVELADDINVCPLCRTPVYHPGKETDPDLKPVFPVGRGEVGAIRNDVAMLFSVVLGSTAAACILLNLLVFRMNLWSAYVAGACLVLWVLSLPVMFVRKVPAALALLADGAVVSLYCGMISWFHPGENWYPEVALPLIWMIAIFIGIYGACLRMVKMSILSRAALLFGEAGILALLTEVVLTLHFDGHIFVSWSAVAATCCGVIVAALLTIIKRSRLREEVRRRMHI